MNQQEADEYDGPTFNCPTCDGRHPLDGSETCGDDADERTGTYGYRRSVHDRPFPDVEEDPEAEYTGFSVEQGEPAPEELLEMENVTTPEPVTATFEDRSDVDRLLKSPYVEITERWTYADRVEVTFTIPVEVER